MNTIWSLRALPIIHYISKFIQQLKTKTDKIKFRLITHKVFSIIGDPSSDYQTIVEWRKQLSAKTLVLNNCDNIGIFNIKVHEADWFRLSTCLSFVWSIH